MSLLILLSFWTVDPIVSLDQLGIYRETSLSMFKTEKGFLLNSAAEGAAVLFNANGIIGSFRQQGQGPGEFNRQYVLKLDEKGIHFCSNGRFVLSFDNSMMPTPAALPNLPAQIPRNASYGIAWDSRSVLVSLSGEPHLFAEIENKNDRWEINKKHFPIQVVHIQEAKEFLRVGQRPLIHQKTVFASRVAANKYEDFYEITVFPNFLKTGRSEEPTLTLAAEINEFKPFLTMRALITNAAQLPTGFVVELVTDMRKGGAHHRWHDYYDEQGRFLKRVNVDGKQLLPVVNDPAIFLIEDQGDDRVLVSFI